MGTVFGSTTRVNDSATPVENSGPWSSSSLSSSAAASFFTPLNAQPVQSTGRHKRKAEVPTSESVPESFSPKPKKRRDTPVEIRSACSTREEKTQAQSARTIRNKKEKEPAKYVGESSHPLLRAQQIRLLLAQQEWFVGLSQAPRINFRDKCSGGAHMERIQQLDRDPVS
eukprot:CAMPEP_0177659478 /NCGR_PEP_ID=MMETSP0447-20121125/17465_1 /TAXON_ID=0 /ORGANISM="Stygamoeba regulata, Strain BSH-02190019" /LENGTH=169 /DNA_ID=CAMNT_0019164353 /DNA_START=14 /DNA_END=523 /DNA_ORIENTATION=-